MGNYYFYTSWASSQYLTERFNMPEIKLTNTSVRQVIHTSIGGSKIRLRFSNRCGNRSLVLKSVHLAKSAGQGTGKIIAETDKTVTFNNKNTIKIKKGCEVYSDLIDFQFSELDELAITIFYGRVPSKVTGHPGSRTFTYFEKKNQVSKNTFSHENKTAHWYTIASLEVLSDYQKPVIVCFGDSITDGRGSTDDKQNRWTDNLSEKLQKNPETKNFAVINQGIGGTCIITNGTERFERDVLNQPGIKQIIMLYGVNDILFLKADANTIIDCYKKMIKKAHDSDIKVFGCTILPFGKNENYTPECESVRKEVNEWIIKTPSSDGGFDNHFDLAETMKDPSNNIALAPENDCGDGLHPSAKGYQVIADTIDVQKLIDHQ